MRKHRLCLLFAIGYWLFANVAEGVVFFYQKPSQYVMAQTKPVPAVKPVLDISGIKEIQSIPVGEMRDYPLRETIEELGLKGYIPLELILDSIANLAIMQMGLEKFVITSSNPGEIIVEGEFGRVLKDILGIDPARDFGLTVEHTDFVQTDLGKKDSYRLTINCRNIDLILRDFAGYDGWGIRGLVLSQDSEIRDAREMPYTEYKELAIHQVEDGQNPGKYKFVALYTVITLAPDGTIVAREEWEFAQRNPNAIAYKKF